MKKYILIIAILFFGIFNLSAQTKNLVNLFTPIDSYGYNAYKSTGSSSKMITTVEGGKWRSGFTLLNSVGPYKPGYATFNLGGKYETLLFVLGREYRSGGGVSTKPLVITVTLDGKKVVDELIYPYSAPKQIKLDVTGVKELKFAMITGEGNIAIAEPTLWSVGEKPVESKSNIASLPNVLQLGKDIKPYYQNVNFQNINANEKQKSLSINGQKYTDGLVAYMTMPMVGKTEGWAYFYTQGEYSKLSFLVGPPTSTTSNGAGWITIKADGKIVYEKKVSSEDIAERISVDINNCNVLSFHSENDTGTSYAGFFDIMVYKDGVEVKTVNDKSNTVDPRLKQLPDICKLISNIPPYAAGSSIKKQIYNGASDYITFSMGGVKFSEGIVLYETADFWDDGTSSYAIFDVGNEFDYLSLTAGYLGKSGAMTNDRLRVYADDELVLDVPMMATQPNMHYTIPINRCRKLRISNRGSSMMSVGAYGVADMVLYRGEPKENDLFVHPIPECPESIDLIDLGLPYIHYVSPMKNDKDKTLYDGTTKRNFFNLNGTEIYKGFLLQTSVHFSLDFGIFYNEEEQSGGTTATAAATIGGAAVGSAFVAGGAAVGGAVVGSTLIGAAALLMLAAGGEAMETSCAAFNTYGEYNSVTFTVACYQPHIKADDYKETLLIGADHEVVAELTVYETMEPQTVTVPINGCEQLLFWLANTDSWSGQFLFYDIKLSKEKMGLDIPKDARLSKVNITLPPQSEKSLAIEWNEPKDTGQKDVDSYMSSVSRVYNKTNELIKKCAPTYEIRTYYLETNGGQICKAVSIKIPNSNNLKSITNELRYCCEELEELKNLKTEIINTNIKQASASLGLVDLGFGAISYGKFIKHSNKVLKECKATLEVIYNEKLQEAQFLQTIVNTSIDIDGKVSTEKAILCPLFTGEVAPTESLQMVRNFNME